MKSYATPLLSVASPPQELSVMEAVWLVAMRQAALHRNSRRALVALAGGLAAAGTLALDDDADARKNGRRKNKRRRKNRKQKNEQKVRADATCPGSENSALRSATGDDRMAQTFTAQVSGPLVKAKLSIGKEPDTIGDFVVRLQPVDGSGSPVEEVLAEAAVANGDVPDLGGFTDFPFAEPFSVVAGTEYALVLTRPGGDRFSWSNEGGDPCGGEAFFAFGQNEQLIPNNDDRDHTFTTFVKS
jgi:hypothetical protein